jgi:hypothetical protein
LNEPILSFLPERCVEVILMSDQVLICDVTDQVQWSENGKDDDLNLLEKELYDQLKSFNFVEIQVVLIQDRKEELFANWLPKNPANSEAYDIDRVTLIGLLFSHTVGKELLVHIDCG